MGGVGREVQSIEGKSSAELRGTVCRFASGKRVRKAAI